MAGSEKVIGVSAAQGNLKLIPQEQFSQRESRELVIAYSGPVGSGAELVIEETEKLLRAAGYTVFRIKLSDYIKKLYKPPTFTRVDLSSLSSANRYEYLQNAGNELREHYRQPDLLAQLAVSKIGMHRLAEHDETPLQKIVPKRQAYIIDQLKRPEEAGLLRAVYGNLFYLIGVLCAYDQRKTRLIHEAGLQSDEAERIMQRDQKQSIEHGQELDKTLELADYFIRNTHSNREALGQQIQRFIDLVHGKNGVTPTKHEYAMYVAHAAGAQSACLSRQVGASIASQEGIVIATGRNDVPKANGGLYSEADGALDRRCINKEGGKCFNDHHKRKVGSQIANLLKDCPEFKEQPQRAEDLAESIYRSTRLKDLIEFSRSIHAEMDAITSVARVGGVSLRGTYLYTTTFPCHNCARHIISTGISRVYFIQPYEKSLASELHGDDIELDPGETAEKANKVQFIHFEGVSPRQYLTFFQTKIERKTSEGKAIDILVPDASKVSVQYLDRYMDLEAKVAEHVSDQLKIKSDVYTES